MGVGADEDIPHFSPDVALAGGTEGGEVGGVEGGGGGGGRGRGEKLGERHGWYKRKIGGGGDGRCGGWRMISMLWER